MAGGRAACGAYANAAGFSISLSANPKLLADADSIVAAPCSYYLADAEKSLGLPLLIGDD